MIIHTVFSEFCRIDLSPYSGCALLRQLTDGWVGEAKRFSPLLKICYTYPAVMKLYSCNLPKAVPKNIQLMWQTP